jgi:putative sterol carrier protein
VPIFPSREWTDEAVRLTNADPEVAAAGADWVGDFGIVVEAERGRLDASFAVHVVPNRGRIERCKILRDPDELEEIEPAYLARARYSVWKALLKGELDPVEAVLRRQIALAGDVQPLIERAHYKGIGDRVLAQIRTVWADER